MMMGMGRGTVHFICDEFFHSSVPFLAEPRDEFLTGGKAQTDTTRPCCERTGQKLTMLVFAFFSLAPLEFAIFCLSEKKKQRKQAI